VSLYYEQYPNRRNRERSLFLSGSGALCDYGRVAGIFPAFPKFGRQNKDTDLQKIFNADKPFGSLSCSVLIMCSFTMMLNLTEMNWKKPFAFFPCDYHPGDMIAVSLPNISSDYYDFLKLGVENPDSFVQYLSQPVNYPSNIKGRQGIFQSLHPDVKVFVLE
jgi:hypothetical protein